ncbi:glycosyltransferase [Bradyrhizobium retamae]|uniref:glycosyltransferase n=1 Tax=Bradyrhizobium retamae TaxID=1300035 RepID=UPI0032213F1E
MTLEPAAPRRRILYVVNEDFAFLLNRLPMARAAREAGFEVHVATRVDKGADAIEAEGFTLHKIPFRRGGLSPFSAIPTIAALRRVEKKIKPLIVHHSGLQCCVYGSIASYGTAISIVNAITGLGYIFTSMTWRTRLLKRSMAMLLPRLLNSEQSLVLVQNPDDQSSLESLGIDRQRITLIPGSGVDTDVLQPLPEPDGPITIGFAGRLLSDKGIRALVAAHGILRDQRHDINLIIAGNPDPANPTSVGLEEVREWSRRPGITWLGHIDDIVSLWRRCHFAVLPSHREGLPMSLLEAAACGRAMIAADAPGCREIVLNEQTGLLVPIEDPSALAGAILRLATSFPLRARYGQAAREVVVNKLSAKIIGKAIVALYDQRVLDHSNRTYRAPDTSKFQAEAAARAGRILLVTQHYAPFPSATSGYMTDIAKALALESDVIVLSGTPNSGSKLTPRPHEPTVIELRSWWPRKSALVSRSLAALTFAVQVFVSVIKHSRRDDAVLCVTTPFTLPYAVTLAARLRRASVALIIHDFYPDSLVMAGFLRPASMVTRTMQWANKVMFQRLNAIVTIGRDMNSILMTYPRMTEEKISFIPNWATLPVRYREIDADNPYRRRCGGKFLVAMSGTAGFTHDPESVFEAARILRDNVGIHFLLSGEGVGWTKLKEKQAASPLSNVTLIERVPETELETFLSAADVWVIPYRKKNTGVSVPSRLYNLLAVGRPVIICSEPEAEAAILVQEHDLGWVVEPEMPASIAQAVTLAASTAGKTPEKGRRAAAVAPRYTKQIALRSYNELMGRLLGKQAGVRAS